MSELERYLDGLLGSADERAFQERLDSEPALGAELARQRAVDAHLQAAFTPPADAVAITRAALSRARLVKPQVTSPMRSFPWLAAAGFLLAAGLALWAARVSTVPATLPVDDARIAALYKDATAGFVPDPGIVACTTPEESRDRTVRHFGQDLVIRFDVLHPVTEPSQDACTLFGASQAYIVGGAERPIVVLVESLLAAPLPGASKDASVHVHRAELGALVLYELSPYPEPRVLRLFRSAPAGR